MEGICGSEVPPDDVAPPLIIALLTKIHYFFFSPSALDIEVECSQSTVSHGEVILMWFGELFVEGGDGIFPDF